MPTYTFISKDLLNTAFLPDEPEKWMGYTIKTTSNVLGPKITYLTPNFLHNNFGDVLHGAIDWRQNMFIIGGKSIRLEKAKAGSPVHADDATFTLRKRRMFREDDPAFVNFSSKLALHDMVFLALVMIYSETKRQQRKEKAALAVGAQ
ncbi:hypothetical protein H0H87_003223 [Tephrocybe sp. NHM501043]|nr:hypothetical protein H0H87_003223 [Tephrocybe sp. NHM501043]